jgi:predicted RNA-binding Zn-ribbon protein involved in translation (DUF1610 family)
MECPHCGANIEKEIDDFVENMGYCSGFIFVCPRCGKALGVQTGKCGKTEEYVKRGISDAGSN